MKRSVTVDETVADLLAGVLAREKRKGGDEMSQTTEDWIRAHYKAMRRRSWSRRHGCLILARLTMGERVLAA